MTAKTSRSMPQWISAAAVSLCVIGGGVWLASQMGSSSKNVSFESAEATAESDMDVTAAVAESSAMKDADEDATEQSTADSQVTPGQEPSTTQAPEVNPSAPPESEPRAADASPSLGDEAVDTDASAASVERATADASGFFPDEPVASFRQAPDANELAQAPPAEPRIDLEQSKCSNQIDLPVQLTGYLPIEVGGNPAEFFIFIDANDAEAGIVLDSDCQPIE